MHGTTRVALLLREASVKGHLDTVRLLLLFELPFGATEDGA
jgi:hypothetical protein